MSIQIPLLEDLGSHCMFHLGFYFLASWTFTPHIIVFSTNEFSKQMKATWICFVPGSQVDNSLQFNKWVGQGSKMKYLTLQKECLKQLQW